MHMHKQGAALAVRTVVLIIIILIVLVITLMFVTGQLGEIFNRIGQYVNLAESGFPEAP